MRGSNRGFVRVAGLATACSVLGVAATTQKPKPAPDPFKPDIAPVLSKFCLPCHSGASAAGGLDLSRFKSGADLTRAVSTWENVIANVSSGHMPPEGMPKPTSEQRKKMVEAIQTILSGDCELADVGRVTIRRLNREEYNNTVRDLVGIEFRPAEDFPSDDVGYGFDNIGDVLSISPLLMEKYLNAAEQIAERAIELPSLKTVRFEGDTLKGTGSARPSDTGGQGMSSAGEAFAQHNFPEPGAYKLRIRAWGHQAGPEPCKMLVKLGNTTLDTIEVRAAQSKPIEIELPLRVGSAGRHRLSAAFINDYYNPQDPNPRNRDRNLFVDFMEVVGPLDRSKPLPMSHQKIIFVQPTPGKETESAKAILGKFATRAYRRPVKQDEIERLIKIFEITQKAGEPFEKGIQIGVEAVLTSPHFLFRVELDPQPKDEKAVRDLNGYELASRLSYFLWSSMPDNELFFLASNNQLTKPAVLQQQVKRMLADPKAKALADNFAGQWLQLRKLETFTPDPVQFKSFDNDLRQAMVTETKMFFEAVVQHDRSVLDFIDGKFTYINEPLAKHYGIQGVSGPVFRKVALPGDQRGGVITQAAVLSVTSNPTRTSPTKRGKWILEQILGTPPPPPPPGVDNLGEESEKIDAKTLRKLMEQHRVKQPCASCHSRMDPLGFGLENYDAIGAWRTTDGGEQIDASGVLPDGRKFEGPAALKKILLARKDDFTRALAEKLLTYGLGRGLESYDTCHLDEIVKQTVKGNYRFSALVNAVVTSEPFRKRRGDGGGN